MGGQTAGTIQGAPHRHGSIEGCAARQARTEQRDGTGKRDGTGNPPERSVAAQATRYLDCTSEKADGYDGPHGGASAHWSAM